MMNLYFWNVVNKNINVTSYVFNYLYVEDSYVEMVLLNYLKSTVTWVFQLLATFSPDYHKYVLTLLALSYLTHWYTSIKHFIRIFLCGLLEFCDLEIISVFHEDFSLSM